MTNLKELLALPNAGSILRELHKRGELQSVLPELAAMDLPSSKHKDMFEHSIRVLENAQELSKDKTDVILFAAALIHDIGKPATRKLEKGGASFVNHDLVGARMVKKALGRHSFTKSEIEEIKVLVRNHMRGHTFKSGWTDSAIRRLAAEAGSVKQVERLGVIFAADATTSNTTRRDRFRSNAVELRDAMLEIIAADAKAARRPAIGGDRVMEMLDLKPGREVGKIMRFLNSEDGLALSESEAEAEIMKRFGRSR